MSQHWKLNKTEENIYILTFDRAESKMNTLSQEVCMELDKHLDVIAADSSSAGLIINSAKKDFCAGADITEFAGFKTSEEASDLVRQMQAVFQKIDDFKFPTVAAVSGQALGGGLELALTCDWRVLTSDPKTKLALPEIQLGLIPGAGGTQRLPRLIGIQSALDLILTGRRVAAKKARRLGLADAVVPIDNLMEIATSYTKKKRPAHKKVAEFDPSKDLSKWAAEGNPIGRKVVQKKAREMVEEKTKGFYPASFKALDAVFEGFEVSLKKGLEIEAKYFGELAITRESHSLIHLFHATTHIKKHPYKDAGIERFGNQKVKTAGVIGAGFMGAGIATVLADRGIRAMLSDPNKESIARGLKSANSYFKKKLERRRIKNFELQQRMNHISPGLNTDGFNQADIVIEAVFEDLGLKQKILAGLEDIKNEDFIFASNTSAIPIKEVAAKAKHPERVIGMHFFSPVEKMPLLEVIITDDTADWVTARTVELGNSMGKQVIVVKDGPGFYTTRALSFFLAEAAAILSEGAPIEFIDKALTNFGFPVGPITLIDEVGIDVGMHVLETVGKAFPSRMNLPEGLLPIANSGRLGRKNKKGFYLYEEGEKAKVDTDIYKLLKVEPNKANVAEDVIVDRCLLVFVNESIRCLEDGILSHAHDGDVGAVFGLGFPPVWGGPFKYVDNMGADVVVKRLRELENTHGERFKPSDLLVKLAKAGEKFFPEEA